jgi:hypothetical protein
MLVDKLMSPTRWLVVTYLQTFHLSRQTHQLEAVLDSTVELRVTMPVRDLQRRLIEILRERGLVESWTHGPGVTTYTALVGDKRWMYSETRNDDKFLLTMEEIITGTDYEPIEDCFGPDSGGRGLRAHYRPLLRIQLKSWGDQTGLTVSYVEGVTDTARDQILEQIAMYRPEVQKQLRGNDLGADRLEVHKQVSSNDLDTDRPRAHKQLGDDDLAAAPPEMHEQANGEDLAAAPSEGHKQVNDDDLTTDCPEVHESVNGDDLARDRLEAQKQANADKLTLYRVEVQEQLGNARVTYGAEAHGQVNRDDLAAGVLEIREWLNTSNLNSPSADSSSSPANLRPPQRGNPGLSREELIYRIDCALQAEEIRAENPEKTWAEITSEIRWKYGVDRAGIKKLEDARNRLKRARKSDSDGLLAEVLARREKRE